MAGALDTAMDTAAAMIDAPHDDSLFVFNGKSFSRLTVGVGARTDRTGVTTSTR